MAPVLIHSDIWTDMAKVTRVFRDYANAPKKDGTMGEFKIIYFIASVLCRIIQFFSWTGNNNTITTSNVATAFALLESDG